ncbi:MAG: AcrB/AcrD/AcrF family protein [Gammaproteobacteria bacterium]|nr:MAG: AcrB/AcrD/AcrF family protein [Gammaproteobacteria bacterium]
MNLAEFSIKNKLLTIIVVLLMIGGGWNAYQNMDRFEDPEFTIRTALIYTQYPGADPQEVDNEVSQPLVKALQQMQEIKEIRSKSTAGLSELSIDIKFKFSPTKDSLQLIWTKIRNKLKDTENSLPSGVSAAAVYDDFGDVYGLYYFITGNDFSAAELRAYAKQLQKEILQVEGVGKVQLLGEQQESIFIEISQENVNRLGPSITNLQNTLQQQNSVVFAGDVVIGDYRIVIDPSGSIDSVKSIQNLLVTSINGKRIYLKDIANVYMGYKTPSEKIVRYNGKPAIALGVANVGGGNVVVMGKKVDKKLIESQKSRPLGIEVSNFYHQGASVESSVNGFIINVILAIIIIVISLLLSMGVRSSLVMVLVLLITVAATLATMNIIGIPLHRISLGALIISLGMMVNNALVITEAILVGVQQGKSKLDVAKKIVSETQWALLAGTLVGVVAFAPIGFAPGEIAEFTGDLFWVIMIALLYSWIFALTITPLSCYWIFPNKITKNTKKTPSKFFSKFEQMIGWSLKHRWYVIGVSVFLFAFSIWGTKFMTHGLFPQTTLPQVIVNYWLPEGTKIEKTQQDMEKIEKFALKMEGVNAVQTLIGGGGIRYMLTYESESNNSSYGQLIVRVDDYTTINSMIPKFQKFIAKNFPDATAKAWKTKLGPGGGASIEAEFSGPDINVLSDLVQQAKKIMLDDDGALLVKDDWRQPVNVIKPIYSEIKASRAGVTRVDLSNAIKEHYVGKQVGQYRQKDDLIPIIWQTPETKRANINSIKTIQILSKTTGKMVPITQITDGFETIWRHGQIRSQDRIYRMKAQSDPHNDELPETFLRRIENDIKNINLPHGYSFNWGGERGDSDEAMGNLMKTIPLGLLAMILIVVVSFGTIKQPLLIWLVVPLATIGVVFGLVVTRFPMEFMGILGSISLSGLLIQNGIILVEKIDSEIAKGKPRFDAVISSTASRVRPVLLGALTTILGFIPLFFDAFFQSMSVVIVFGLGFATILTLFIVPVLYSLFFKISIKETAL